MQIVVLIETLSESRYRICLSLPNGVLVAGAEVFTSREVASSAAVKMLRQIGLEFPKTVDVTIQS